MVDFTFVYYTKELYNARNACAARRSPLEVGGINMLLIVMEVVIECGKDGGCDAALLPLFAMIQLVKKLQEGRLLENGFHKLLSSQFCNIQKTPALAFYVQTTLQA